VCGGQFGLWAHWEHGQEAGSLLLTRLAMLYIPQMYNCGLLSLLGYKMRASWKCVQRSLVLRWKPRRMGMIRCSYAACPAVEAQLQLLGHEAAPKRQHIRQAVRTKAKPHLQLLQEQPALQRLHVRRAVVAAQLRVGHHHAVLLGVLVRQQLRQDKMDDLLLRQNVCNTAACWPPPRGAAWRARLAAAAAGRQAFYIELRESWNIKRF